MRNQIIASFLVILAVCFALVFCQREDVVGGGNKNYSNETKSKKLNVFKWTTDKNYRQTLIKRINENI
jgi:uncharacterized membrane protein